MSDLEDDANWIVHRSWDPCDPARALRMVIDALVDANLQEAEEEDSETEHAAKLRGQALLFLIATACTDGHRWSKDSE